MTAWPPEAAAKSLPAWRIVRIQARIAGRRMARWRPAIIWTAAAGVLALATYGEMPYSLLQSSVFSSLARTMDLYVRRGSHPAPCFPQHGPYDSRLGHVPLPPS